MDNSSKAAIVLEGLAVSVAGRSYYRKLYEKEGLGQLFILNAVSLNEHIAQL